ncbi:P-loop containing nucleoside triphosphate hydrolase protein [Halteromyces radiatus]|uniref:P-loop containing nucleoside triphosphate hydrolase protein n=1 Tax=Halteromyces radiatus TaxID=101107 RepID=UPI00221F6239|nr:P-loop containing nucleoside triphosphate hydrolase protein [Halteromyces radiatus]KAI8083030.1 P-loop containing nucleoside triphosphate hydrolase protein [Halteromyces radiatus]
MVIKKAISGNKKLTNDTKKSNNNKTTGQSKNKRNQVETTKEISNTKLKKREYHKKKYNKKDKDEEEDSDFEIVPIGSTFDNNNDDNESDSDLEMDMFGNLINNNNNIKPIDKPQQEQQSTASILSKPITLDDQDSDQDNEDDEKFIAKENMLANRKNKKSGGFQSMGLSSAVYKAIIHKGFKVPTPIQRKCIPIVLQGEDVVGMARTGSGKTAAFLIPLFEKLKTHSAKVGARALLLSPSRELALQTQKVCKELGKYTDLRSCVLVGGDSLDDQFSMLASNPDILIATPGRLLHLAVEMSLDLRTVQYVVFDEADRLFEMGFAVQLHEILSRLPPTRQTLLFSATLPKMLVDFAKAGLQEPTLVRLDVDTKISRDLEMAFFSVKEVEKEAALLYLLRNVIKLPKSTNNKEDDSDKKKKKKKYGQRQSATEDDHQTILFAATKHHVEYLANILTMSGYQVSYVYGSLDQTARNVQITRFRTGVTNILVVTDVAARGIDIPILENVINYDFCGSSKVFVHRVGRAARAGRRGWAYSLMTPEELPYLVDLELFLTRPLVLGNEKDQIDYTRDLSVGTMPKDALADDVTWVQQKVASDAELQGLVSTANNAYKLYNRTKPRASPESYTRAKELLKRKSWKELHPLLVNDENSSAMELERLEMINMISGFRPSETIFEVGQRGTRKVNPATAMMRERRQNVGKTIGKFKSQAAEEQAAEEAAVAKAKEDAKNNKDEKVLADLGDDVEEEELVNTFNIPVSSTKKENKPKSYRDEEFYISYTQKDANTERGYAMNTSGNFLEQAGQAQLDLIGDDNDTINSKRNQLRWDSKKHKFVKGTGIGSDNKKMIRTESGALIPASYKSGRFDEWTKKTRTNIPRTGEQELPSAGFKQQRRFKHNRQDDAKPLDPLAFDYDKKMKKRKREEEDNVKSNNNNNNKRTKVAMGQRREGGRGVANELKTAGQIRKARVQTAKRKEKSNRTPKKGKGKGGRR